MECGGEDEGERVVWGVGEAGKVGEGAEEGAEEVEEEEGETGPAGGLVAAAEEADGGEYSAAAQVVVGLSAAFDVRR